MKWFKHMSAANSDNKLVGIRAEFGMWGVGCYWTILELVATQMKGEEMVPEAVFKISDLTGMFGCKRDKLRSFLDRLRNDCGMIVTLKETTVKLRVPKLLEIKDNYAKDLEVTPKFLPSKDRDIEGEEERDVVYTHTTTLEDKGEEETPFRVESKFEQLWGRYPSRTGRKEAERHYRSSVRTPEDEAAIEVALTNYLGSGNVKRGYVKNGSTWFNNWRDWVEPTEFMMRGRANGTGAVANSRPSDFSDEKEARWG